MAQSPEQELADFLAPLPQWLRKALSYSPITDVESYSWLDSINPFTADQLEELKANPGWQPERYGHTADELRPTFEQILRRCNRDMWKRYRDNAKAARKAEADFRVPMPTGTPGPKQNVELAARIKGFVAEGKSSEQIRQILEGEKVNLSLSGVQSYRKSRYGKTRRKKPKD